MMIMEVGLAPKAPSLLWNPKLTNGRRAVPEAAIRNFSIKATSVPYRMRCTAASSYLARRTCRKPLPVCALVSEEVGVSSSQFVDFQVVRSSTADSTVVKISVEVSGTKTRAIFDDVFDRMVEAAQPIPGFRRVKGGKTPNIPRDVLLETIGASRVFKKVIQKVINSVVADYVEKEGLKVGKDLKVEQSLEDLEDAFNPGEKFNFDALLRLQAAAAE